MIPKEPTTKSSSFFRLVESNWPIVRTFSRILNFNCVLRITWCGSKTQKSAKLNLNSPKFAVKVLNSRRFPNALKLSSIEIRMKLAKTGKNWLLRFANWRYCDTAGNTVADILLGNINDIRKISEAYNWQYRGCVHCQFFISLLTSYLPLRFASCSLVNH